MIREGTKASTNQVYMMLYTDAFEIIQLQINFVKLNRTGENRNDFKEN